MSTKDKPKKIAVSIVGYPGSGKTKLIEKYIIKLFYL